VRFVHRQVRFIAASGLEETRKAALAAKPTRGRPKKLTAKQSQKFRELLLTGAMARGFPNELWTLKRISTLIRKEFGVRYHPSHLWRVLQSCW
jgi:transposase